MLAAIHDPVTIARVLGALGGSGSGHVGSTVGARVCAWQKRRLEG